MRHRVLISMSTLAAAAAILPLAPVPATGQSSAKSAPKVVAKTPASTSKFVAPKTPWGDPDIQGWFTNVYEDGTPLERPAQFEGRRLEDIRGEELAAYRKNIEKRTIQNFEGPIHGPDGWWQTALHLEKGGQAWFITDPPEGKIPPLTEEAKKRQAERAEARKKSGRGPADGPEDRNLYDRCITRGVPGSMMPAIYGNSYHIQQSPGYVVIRYEMVNEARIIPVGTQRAHVGNSIRKYMGDAIAHWEGDSLVVETTNWKENATYRNADPDSLKLIERFTRVAPDKVRWEVTVNDPKTWTRPWTFAMPLTENDSEPLLEYACHEGNYGLRNILTAARAEDAAAQKGGK